ncbi:hypothetical protein RhiirC2_774981 [Rhizophagus irregularis]|uniref:Uncharacterized protein n=1 Tax=Rhizophagus irregularis TaxID=588596 RepID=A0A2N1NK20_9GLOM|nr:hypothetical protein RhiirC2_774981 [Rhizophagus irregularis]
MKKIFILIFIIFIILLQFIHEVNTQGAPGPPPEGAVPSPAKAPPKGVTPAGTASPPPSAASASSSASAPVSASSVDSSIPSNIIAASIIGGIVSGLILIFLVGLCYFLVRMYKNKQENSKAITTHGLNNVKSKKNISNPGIMNDELYNEPIPTELIISNHGQEFIPNSPNYNNNQQGITRELGNNLTNNEIIQNIRQGNLSSFNIDEDIIDQMKQDILQDIKQELKQNIKSKIMTSFVRDNDVEDDSSSSSSKNHI